MSFLNNYFVNFNKQSCYFSSVDFTMISFHKIITIASGIFPSVTGNITANGDTAPFIGSARFVSGTLYDLPSRKLPRLKLREIAKLTILESRDSFPDGIAFRIHILRRTLKATSTTSPSLEMGLISKELRDSHKAGKAGSSVVFF